MISFLWACVPIQPSAEQTCFTEAPQAGEIRIHPVSCFDERSNPYVRNGDWIIENHLLRFVIRNQSSSMTRHEGPGASIVDTGKETILFELRSNDLSTPLTENIIIDDETASLSFLHQDNVVLQYRLPVDSNKLEIHSESSWSVFLYPQSHFFGNTLISSNRLQGIYVDGKIQQEDHFLHIDELQSIQLAPWEELYKEQGIVRAVAWTDDTVPPYALLLRNQERQYFIAMKETFDGYIPEDAIEWTLYAPGCQKKWLSTNEEPQLGECLRHHMRVSDNTGIPLWSQTQEGDLIPPNGGHIYPEEDPITIAAGSAYEKGVLTNSTDIDLERIHPNSCAFHPFVESTNPNSTIPLLLGAGVQNAIISTRNFISPFSVHLPLFSQHISIERGFILGDETTWILSWPWAPVYREAGLGSIPSNIPKQTQLSYVDRGGRTSVASVDFLAQLHEENPFVHPDFLYIEDSTELNTMFSMLDAQEPLRFLGPQNWLANNCTLSPLPKSERDQQLFAQQHSFGNGPLIQLLETQEEWNIEAYAPSWMDVDQIMLIGENATVLAQWEMDGVEKQVSWPKTNDAWTLAIITGEHWAVSAIYFYEENEE